MSKKILLRNMGGVHVIFVGKKYVPVAVLGTPYGERDIIGSINAKF